MEQTAHSPSKLSTLLDYYFNSLRHRLTKHNLISLVQAARALVHFGPWRVVPKKVIQQLRPPKQTCEGKTISLLENLDAAAIADDLRQNSVAIAGVLPTEFVQRLRSVTDHLPCDHYQLMHLIDDDIRRLSEDPSVQNVLRAYLKAEPVLLESTLLVNLSYETNGLNDQNSFHFDFAGWDSLNVFVYLTDVTIESSPHTVAKGSHRNVGVRDALRGALSDEEALQRFGNTIQPITGPAGTVFFENTEAFHRRHPGNERRVMLNLLFASHRSYLSHGRTSNDEIKRRTLAYEQLRKLN